MTTCFRTLAGSVYNVSNTDFPCGGSDPTGCCKYGDLCLSNGICRYTRPSAAESGFYLQSSTDPTFQGTFGQEVSHCTTLDYSDIVYNGTTDQWACCGTDPTNAVRCSLTTNEVWADPAPAALNTLASIQQPASASTTITVAATAPPGSSPSASPVSSLPLTSSAHAAQSSSTSLRSSPSPLSTTATSSSPVSSRPTSSVTSPSSSNTAAVAATTTSTSRPTPSSSIQNGSLSVGAKAGIGVGVTVAIIALISLLFFTIRTAHHRRRDSNAGLFGGPDPTSDPPALGPKAEMSPYPSVPGRPRPPVPPRFTGEPQFPFPLPQRAAGGGRRVAGGGSGPAAAGGGVVDGAANEIPSLKVNRYYVEV